jgi:signal transduction histidine kinase
MPLKRERVALADIVTRAFELYGDVAEAKGLTVTSDVDAGVAVMGDRVRLEQVAANLMDNAVKYTPGGGTVTIRVAAEPGYGAMSVTDSGPGIPADELPHVWERLFRGDKSRAERGQGLGLSLVKAIVEAHGGSVEVASQPGQGAAFTARIPSLSPM